MTTFDFNTLLQRAKAAKFEAIPAGDYDVQIVEANATTASTGKPMIKVKMQVISGPHANTKVFNQFVLSMDNEKALAMFFRHMKSFGLDDNFFMSLGQLTDLGPVANALMSRQARVTLGIRQWQGEDQNEVKSVKPLQGAVAPNGLPGAAIPQPGAMPAAPGMVPTPQPTPAPVTPAPVTPAPAAAAPAMPAAPAPAPVAPAPVIPATPAPAPVAPVAPVAPAPQPAETQAPAPAPASPAPPAPVAQPAPEVQQQVAQEQPTSQPAAPAPEPTPTAPEVNAPPSLPF